MFEIYLFIFFFKYKIRAFSFAAISNWTPTYTLTLMKAAGSLRGPTSGASLAKPDKTPIIQRRAAAGSFFQNPGKTAVLLVLPPMAPLSLMHESFIADLQ